MERKKRVLLADASEEFRRVLAGVLAQEQDMEMAGETGDGEEAVRLAGTCAADVLVMDMVLARMDGLEVLQAVHALPEPPRVLVLSGFVRGHMADLAAEHGAVYLFEASVGGGIPILRPLSDCMAANDILEICGILNGTANYIFTRMVQDGVPFEQALKGAQANGYAEQDPTADVEGHDTCRKLCILSSIAFGWHVLPEQVATQGITKITLEDEAYAAACGHRIKLLGRSIIQEDGSLCAYVEPHFVSVQDPLGGVEDVFNAIKVKGDATGDVMFYGRGAGRLPTASAVVADVIAAARKMERAGYRPWQANRPEGVRSPEQLESRWYVRLASGSFSGGQLLTRPGAAEGEGAYLTPPMSRQTLEAQLRDQKVLSVIRVLD